MKPNATLKKISEMLNISISTVSRALKNHPDISESTKQKVQELAQILEYEPNTYAISLRTNNSKLFGVILPSISNFFYHSFIAALEEEARTHGYSLLILQSGDEAIIEQENIKLCKANRIAGLFVSITPQTNEIDAFKKIEEQGIPVIFFDKVPAYEACNKVCVADIASAELAANALIMKKKKNILAFFGNVQMSISSKRLEGFTNVFKQQAPTTILNIEYAHSPEAAQLITKQYFSKKTFPDAVFCMSDEILTGVMKSLQQKNITIPKQTAVVAISNGFIPTLYHPEISFVETSGAKLAKLSFSRMMSCLAGSTFMQELTLDAVFVKGASI
jgi:LacI family transcriptional regulator